MPAHLSPDALALDPDEQDRLRPLNRSPHPYHHQSSELPHLSDRFRLQNGAAHTSKRRGSADGGDSSTIREEHTSFQGFSKESTPGSESGTEADDEHFLKGLPAPKTRLHKGLRGRNEPLSGAASPLPSPSFQDEDKLAAQAQESKLVAEKSQAIDILRRNKNTCRRATEAVILAALGCVIATHQKVSPLVAASCKGKLGQI